VSKQSKKKILLIGYKSFIQTNLYNHLKQKYDVRNIRFENINHEVFKDCSIVINCSNNKFFFEKNYLKKNDRNLIISNLIHKKKIKFILLSTRQVYLPKLNITEASKLAPMNVYAKNCLNSEKFCKEKLKNNLLVLRLSNVVGIEQGYKQTCKQLYKWQLKFDKLIFGKPSYDFFIDDKCYGFKKNWYKNLKLP